ncbi:YbgF trimerization domain-containing protein [Acinetobacter shaoyimingii]|uniref:Tetratricopeptide repeat protein n=1 Tax=Acinetobacter shaoyimingii TaxID=2715164 RepID=A0A6G8RVP3_9GAMM|nr:YbgF trimerization domain-containing protein [Acinetobacter shaoyimingii]NHB57394.1 tetratricopeptide repeat protein [Acinetobacter shaoyimingii]QIO06009.1 tetratricopeptide repeat protein [Acinetobacter shaoyimingii]
MRLKYNLLTLALLSSTTAFAANVPIESHGLSKSSSASSSSTTASTSNNMNWDLLQQVQRLEAQVRELRGKVDEQDHQIEQLNKELTNRYTDLDQRLELLKQKVDPSDEESTDSQNQGATEPSNAPSTSNTEINNTTNNTNPINAAAPTQDAPTTQNDVTTAKDQTSSSTNNTNQVEQEKAAYTIALDAYKQGGAKKAIAPMQNFIRNNPNSVYTGNAYFWLAEFNLAIDPPNYTDAKQNYEIVATKFPNSAKASRALYQLYSISKDVNNNTQTAEVYKKKLLSTYPDSEEAGYFKKK